MVKVSPADSLAKVQEAIYKIYGLPDDRLYSVWDLLSNQERFTMRALKGIRKSDQKKLKANLIISISWLLAIMNRFHIDVDTQVWKRFPYLCSYCGKCPCNCRRSKIQKRVKITNRLDKKPLSLFQYQRMFDEIYPKTQRTVEQAGIHLAEELGELSEAIHMFLGEHRETQFKEIGEEAADFFSCAVGLANSAGIDVAKEFASMFKNNCHVCHQAPCVCNFTFVAKFKS